MSNRRGSREDVRGARSSISNKTFPQNPQHSYRYGHSQTNHCDGHRQYLDIQFTDQPFDRNLGDNMVVYNRSHSNDQYSQSSHRNYQHLERHGHYPCNTTSDANWERRQRFDFDPRESQPSQFYGPLPTSNTYSARDAANIVYNPNNITSQSRENSTRRSKNSMESSKSQPLMKEDMRVDYTRQWIDRDPHGSDGVNTRARQWIDRNPHGSASGLPVDKKQIKDAGSAMPRRRNMEGNYQPGAEGKNHDNTDERGTSHYKRKPKSANNSQEINDWPISEARNKPVSTSNPKINRIASISDDNREEITASLQTRAGLTIKKKFTTSKNLMETVNQCKPQINNVNLTFIEDSITCGANKSFCVVVLQSESKQSANEWIKHLCQNLEKNLQTEVSCDISNTENDERRQEQQIEPSHTNTSKKRGKDLIDRFEKTSNNKNNDSPKSDGKQASSQFHLQDRREKISKTEPKPVPTKILITIGKEFPDEKAVQDFLKGFKILGANLESVDISKTTCSVVAPSKSSAGKIIKNLNSRKGDICITAQVQIDDSPKNNESKIEHLEQQINEMLRVIESKMKSYLDNHEAKTMQCKKAFEILQPSSRKRWDDEVDELEALALKDKLTEAEKQAKEFLFQINALKMKVKSFDPAIASIREMNNILQNVGIECNRLKAALPMYARRQEIVAKVRENQVSIIIGETGSGKSTQLAQYIYDAGLHGDKLIVCTQPRKVAAITLGERVAQEMSGKVGSLVGYKTGIKKVVSANTKIIYSTDHCLLNECLKDPDLSSYSCIIVDEAHERSIYTDLLLGMIKASLARRPDLKVIITSATIDPAIFIKYFKSGPELRVSGRTFPVDVVYEDMDGTTEFEDYETKAVAKAVSVHKTEGQGDILVFLTSPVEIMRCSEEFEKQMKGENNYKCFPLHGQLGSDEQRKVFEKLPEGIRKIVFATNCAETSITIDGIKFVIDTGVAKEMRYDAKKNISLLGTHVISQSSADQRKGRAGRTSSGKCFRLYSESGYMSMAPTSQPEILRMHLGQAVLKLAELGIDCTTYDFVESPSQDALDSALSLLTNLGALNGQGITEVGQWISKLPFDPRQGYLVYQGNKENLLYDSVVLAALISNGSNIFYRGLTESDQQKSSRSKSQFGSIYGDIFTCMEIYKTWIKLPKNEKSKWCQANSINYKIINVIKNNVNEIAEILNKELKIKFEFSFSHGDTVLNIMRKVIFEAYLSTLSHFLGHSRAGYYALVVDRQVHFHPSSSLINQNSNPDWVVYTELTKTSRDFIRGITVADEDWVREAIEKGKLAVNMEQVINRKVDIVHREELGQSMFKNLVGPRFANLRVLEDELSTKGMVTVVVEADRDLGTVDIYSSTAMSEETMAALISNKTHVLKSLEADEEEIAVLKNSVGEDTSGFRVALGQGASVKSIFMPDESNKILITKTSHNTPEEEMREKFEAFGRVKECIRFKSSDPWGFIRYGSSSEARRAVEGTKDDETNRAKLKLENRQKQLKSKLEARLTWCRRPIKPPGTAFIKCSPIDKPSLVGRCIYLPCGLREIKVSRDENDLICFKTSDSNEDEIKKCVMELLGNDERSAKSVHVIVIREKVTTFPNDEVRELKKELTQQFKILMQTTKEKFQVNMQTPKENSCFYVAFIHFDNPDEGVQACRLARESLSIRGNTVEVNPTLKTTIFVPKAIMDVCNSCFDDIKKYLDDEKEVNVTTRQMKLGDHAIDIKATKAEELVEARNLFQKVLDGDIIDCGLNDLVRGLLKYEGRKLLKTLGEKTGVYLMIDERKEKIHLYGTDENINLSKIQINQYLDKLADGNTVEITLRGHGKPPGLMKELMLKYGSSPDNLTDKFGLNSVKIDFKQQKLSLSGPKDCVEVAVSSIAELEKNLSLSTNIRSADKSMPDCVVCMCPVIGGADLYRLEGCGHGYCHSCLKLMISVTVDDKQFPLTCACEGCPISLVWKDLRFFLRKKWILENKLVERAIDNFVATNSDMFKFCQTPNCPVVYEITDIDEGFEFHCPACSVSLCTSCHKTYHPGLTCKMVVSQKEADKAFEEWKRAEPDKRKGCPVCRAPVEKTEGCNHMDCSVCKTCFCWLCLKVFPDEQKCYAHLVKAHGGIF